MALVSLDLTERQARIQWSSEMRIFLCCMIKYFEEDHSAFQEIFNAQFARELEEYGFINGMTARWTRLEAQWVSMRKDGDLIWGDVHTSSFDPEPWLPFIEMIEETAASLNISITRKHENTVDFSQFIYRDSPAGSKDILIQDNKQLDACYSSDLETPLCTAGGKTCFWCHAESTDQRVADTSLDTAKTPPLLYRWWNAGSQGVNAKNKFVAGLFSDIFQEYFAPESITEDDFQNFFKNHVSRKHVPSPFISTFKSALAPIHRALRKEEGASVSIIDTKRLGARTYSALDYMRKWKFKVKNSNYNGAGEYLVWGQIDNAIICTFKITTLRQISQENTDINQFLQLYKIAGSTTNRRGLHQAMAKNAVYLDKKAGVTVGRLLSLLAVPHEYIGTVSEGIAYSWRVKTRRIPWRDFFEGVELGYRGELVMLSPGLSPVPDAQSPDPHATYGDIGSDLDVYSLSEDLSDDNNDDLEASDSSVTNSLDEDIRLNGPDPHDTPAPKNQLESKRSVSIVDFEETLETQHMNASFTIDIAGSSDERLDDKDEELDLFDGVILEREQMTSDLFASERTWVKSALE